MLLNGTLPPGLVAKDGQALPGPDGEKIVLLFNKYIGGRSLKSLCADAKDILGRGYSPRGMKLLLSNKRYLEAGLIPVEMWDKVQTILSVRATRSERTGRVYLFSGIIFCPVCGGRLAVHTQTWNGKEYTYYRCDRKRTARCTWGKSVKEDELEAFLLKRINHVIRERNLSIQKKKEKPVNVQALQRKLDKLTDLYLEDGISKEDFDNRAAPLRDAIKTAKSEPKPIEDAQIVQAVDVYPTLSKKAQKAFWSALIKSIVPTGEHSFDVFLL